MRNFELKVDSYDFKPGARVFLYLAWAAQPLAMPFMSSDKYKEMIGRRYFRFVKRIHFSIKHIKGDQT